MSKYSQRSGELFKQGYNCAQSVFAAFCEETGMDFETALKLSSSFGAGMGRLREVCGAVSGMFMVTGIMCGYADPKDRAEVSQHYALIQHLASKFKEKTGSIVCSELLGLKREAQYPLPEQRTEAYYKKRPCIELVELAASLTEEMINSTDSCIASKERI